MADVAIFLKQRVICAMTNKYREFISRLPKQLRNNRWLFALTKPFVPSLLLLLLFDVVTSLLGIASAIVSKYVIDSATASASLTLSVIILVSVTAAMLVINVAASLITIVINEKYTFHIRQKIFDQILKTEWLQITQYHSGDLLTRLKSDIGAVAGGITDVVPSIITLVVRLVAAFFTLLYYDASLAVFALILGPVSVAVSWIMGRKLKKLQIKVQESESKYSSFIQECLENILIIKSFVAEERSSVRLQELYQERLRWILKKNRMSIIAGTTVSFFFSFGYILAFIWGAVKLSLGRITFGTMTVFLSLVSQVQGPIVALARTIPQIISVMASAERITELSNLTHEDIGNDPIRPVINVGITIENVDFAYSDEKILMNAGLKINPGDTVAIVGPSGIGKTTLVRLLMSIVKPQNGEISVFGENDFFMQAGPSMRNYIGYVPQGNTLFSGRISDNLRMGKPDATEQEMEAALRSAAADFVLDLPQGINTIIGERGQRLSEGQAQRIAIARAVIRKSPVLILDEATSSLDAETELRVLEEIRALKPKPTCVIITHRKSILAFCNREIALEDGAMKEVKIFL